VPYTKKECKGPDFAGVRGGRKRSWREEIISSEYVKVEMLSQQHLAT